jgi:hypothetical protein
MCICCCTSRTSLLIYAIVVTAFTFIYGIVTIADFGSSSRVYKVLKASIDAYEDNKNNPYNVLDLWDYISSSDAKDFTSGTISATDWLSIAAIQSLTPQIYEQKNIGVIKSLKGIDNGLGVILFIFSFLLLGAEVFYLIFACGIKESQVLSAKLYSIFNIFKIITYAISITSIFLSILYGILLLIALIQYAALINIIDSCSVGIILGMVYSYYCFWVYITLSCIFGKERKLFIDVGSAENPGTGAMYDISGNAIVKAVITSQVVALNPQIIVQPQQVQVVNQGKNPNPQQMQGQIGTSERGINAKK